MWRPAECSHLAIEDYSGLWSVRPKLAVAMSEGTLVEWLVGEGDAVADGQALYVVETDKVEAEVPSSTSGVVHLSNAQLSMLLEGIDWRRPTRTWQPQRAA